MGKIKKRIIINIYDDTDEMSALTYALKVVVKGRVSKYGKGFCYASVFESGTVVQADRNNDTSDTFRIWKQEKAKP